MDGDVFSAAVLEKLPLADSVWRLLHFTMDDSWLDDLWERQRGRCYERDLKFSTLAHLIADALLEHGGSGRQAFERAQEAEILPVSIGSAYEKLGNLPVALSEAMLEEGTQRMNAVLPEDPGRRSRCRDCWDGSRSLRRRRQGDQACQTAAQAVARPAGGHPGGAGVGGLEPADGHWRWRWSAISTAKPVRRPSPKTCCRSWRRRPAREAWVVVLDRLYCNLSFPQQVLKAGGHFLIRYCTNTTFVPDPARPAQESRDAQGHADRARVGLAGQGREG